MILFKTWRKRNLYGWAYGTNLSWWHRWLAEHDSARKVRAFCRRQRGVL